MKPRPPDALADAVAAATPSEAAVLFVGNPMRGDDAFGPRLYEAVAPRLEGRAFNGGDAPENLLPAIARLEPRLVIVADAVTFGGEPGALAVLEPAGMRTDGFDTHTASLSIVAEFLRESCGARIVVLAAEPLSTALGAPLSPAMKEAVEKAAGILVGLLGSSPA